MNIVIVGTGYVGITTGVCLAHTGLHVTCVDIDEQKINILKQGKSPIFEAEMEELMKLNRERIRYTTDFKKSYQKADIIFIAVGTPEKKDGSANLSFVFEVARHIAHFAENDCVVVIKSTVPIGTNDRIEAFIQTEIKQNIKIHVASSPEFLAQGTAIRDTLHASRIIIGVESDYAESVLRKVYAGFKDVPIFVTNRRSAEMIKYASNDFLALKISYINEIANLCEIVGANVEDVAKGMGYDDRIGDRFLQAGIGYGGSCFPKDTKALHWFGNFNDYEIKTIKAAIEINEHQKVRLIKKARKYYASLEGLTVAVLGLTFKPGTDDMREAPSLINIPMLVDDLAHVKAYDPIGVENFKKVCPEASQVNFCSTIEETLYDADICLIFTEWPEIKAIKPEIFVRYMKHPIVLDGRNCYPVQSMVGSGCTYDSIGRGIAQ